MNKVSFKILQRDKNSKARAGIIKTTHGNIETPAFVPVGTQGTVKAISPRELREAGAQIVLSNTYHLHLRPGEDLIKKLGGLTKWMSWNGPTMTDSGGFQVFSLGVGKEGGGVKFLREESKYLTEEEAKPRLNKITEEGVTFQSHIDGSKHFLSPEVSIKIQEKLGADLIVAFDDLESPKYDFDKTRSSLELTNRWEIRSKKTHKSKFQLLYGVTHGGKFEELRVESARFVDKHFDAIALGGAHLNKKNLYEVIGWTNQHVSEEKPKHQLGIGEIDDVFEIIERGIDTFDCVIPTRIGRTGFFFISPPFGNNKNRFRTDIDKPQYRKDSKPLDENCRCYACQNFSRAYIHHLFRSRELLSYNLLSLHNVHFLINLTNQIRDSILNNQFAKLKNKWMY
jgi:queuine tRNA-ribosyltransferase